MSALSLSYQIVSETLTPLISRDSPYGTVVDSRVFVQTCSRDDDAITSYQVVAASPAKVVGMSVSDHGAVDPRQGSM